jgi:hypothetical protein
MLGVVENELHPTLQTLDPPQSERLVGTRSAAPRGKPRVARLADAKMDVVNVFVAVRNDATLGSRVGSQNVGLLLLLLVSDPPPCGMVNVRFKLCGPHSL